MISPAMRDRLEALNRQALPASIARAHVALHPAPSREDPLDDVRLLDRGEVIENSSGSFLRITVPLVELWKQGPKHVARACRQMNMARNDESIVHPELEAFDKHFPKRALFLDLETCGFAGSAIFLIGLLRESRAGLVVEQLLARNYAEERAILEHLWQVAAENLVLSTFNGKSFDWPMVHDRSTLHHLGCDARNLDKRKRRTRRKSRGPLARQDPRPELVHFDLLHHARRRWKKKLPNCKLQTLELYLCGRRRTDDIPGSLIPTAYHDYVRSGNPREMHCILHHNLLDLVTLLQVALRIAATLDQKDPAPML